MVALAGCVVATVATAGAAGPAVLAGVQAGAGIGGTIGTGVGLSGVVAGTTAGTTIAGTAAISGAAGAIGGSVAAGTGAAAVAGAAGGAVSGATAGAAVSSIGIGIFSGPVGWAILGAKEDQSTNVYTFDCWKPVLHDDSTEPSNGKILREVIIDPRIKQVTTINNTSNKNMDLPCLVLENIWDEQFLIEYVSLPFDQLAAHAVRI